MPELQQVGRARGQVFAEWSGLHVITHILLLVWVGTLKWKWAHLRCDLRHVTYCDAVNMAGKIPKGA